MQNPVKERIVKLRDEMAQISEANRLYLQGGLAHLSAVWTAAIGIVIFTVSGSVHTVLPLVRSSRFMVTFNC